MTDEEGRPREPTRKELAEALAQSQALNARMLERLDALEAKQAPPMVSLEEEVLRRELAVANAELAQKRQLLERVQTRAATPDVQLVPYAGLVQADVACCMERKYEKGEVFYVEVTALWTDDPYHAVIIQGERDDGTPRVLPNPDAPQPINFRFRKVVSAAEDPTPRRASEY